VAYTAFANAIFNTIFPIFAKMLTECEAHSLEGNKQSSLYLIIVLFRWAAIVITLISPFTFTPNKGALIDQIDALFFAKIPTSNFLQLLNVMGQPSHLAPRAATQDAGLWLCPWRWEGRFWKAFRAFLLYRSHLNYLLHCIRAVSAQ
jgi:hypothetical protein